MRASRASTRSAVSRTRLRPAGILTSGFATRSRLSSGDIRSNSRGPCGRPLHPAESSFGARTASRGQIADQPRQLLLEVRRASANSSRYRAAISASPATRARPGCSSGPRRRRVLADEFQQREWRARYERIRAESPRAERDAIRAHRGAYPASPRRAPPARCRSSGARPVLSASARCCGSRWIRRRNPGGCGRHVRFCIRGGRRRCRP